MGPEATLDVASGRVHLLGTIPGFVPDGQRVRAALARRPGCIALGIPPEDIEALDQLAADPALVATLPETDEWTQRFFGLLAPFGETRIPSLDLELAHAHARTHDVPLHALDIDDEAHTDEHTARLKMRHIIAMNRARNRLLVMPLRSDDPYTLAALWDAQENRSRPLQAIQAAREEHMAKQIRRLAVRHASVLAIVPAPRHASIAHALAT